MDTSILRDSRFVVIGAGGNIGRVLLARLAAAGVPPANVQACDSDASRAEAAAAEYGVASLALSSALAGGADVILIATPPKSVPGILRTLAASLRSGQVVVSLAAGVPLDLLEALVPTGVAVARVMPHPPAMIGRGMSPVAYGRTVTARARDLIEGLLATMGQSVVVSDDQMAWCVGLSGAAMRTVLPVLEGMTQAGIEAGLSADDALRVAAQAMIGTASLARETRLGFDALRKLTPMQTLDDAAVSRSFTDVARAARDKVEAMQKSIIEAEPMTA